MARRLRFGALVFVTAFVVNVVVVAVWPDGDVDWVTSAVVAAATAIALTAIVARSSSSDLGS